MIKSSKEIYSLIDERLHQYVSEKEYIIERVSARSLLTANRFDLAFKLFYLRNRKINVSLAEKCFYEHLNAFSAGTFVEADNPGKNSYDRYYQDFEIIEKSLLDVGFDPSKSLIPLASDGSILNGSHRVSVAILHDLDVYTIRLAAPKSIYNYEFFEKRFVKKNLILLALNEYLKFNKQSRLAIVWPAGNNAHDNLWAEFPNIVFKMNVKLSLKGLSSFMREVYPKESWLGDDSNNYAGAHSKAFDCYSEDTDLTAVIFESTKIPDIIAFKDELRMKCNVGKHAVHITDDIIETIETSRVILNSNNHHFFENESFKIKDRESKIDRLKLVLKEDKISTDEILLDGGMVMEAYGLREASDIDILTLLNIKKFSNSEEYDIHDCNIKLDHYKRSLNDLILDPELFFWFKGV